jgi:deoxyribodipyrimidine photolyase-related protein
MGTFADGGLMTTKPYVAGSAYLDRMSDACPSCQFNPQVGSANACPLTPMYWAFLARNRTALAKNERMKLPLASAAKRTAAQQASDAAVTSRVQQALRQGQRLPADVVASATRPSD